MKWERERERVRRRDSDECLPDQHNFNFKVSCHTPESITLMGYFFNDVSAKYDYHLEMYSISYILKVAIHRDVISNILFIYWMLNLIKTIYRLCHLGLRWTDGPRAMLNIIYIILAPNCDQQWVAIASGKGRSLR